MPRDQLSAALIISRGTFSLLCGACEGAYGTGWSFIRPFSYIARVRVSGSDIGTQADLEVLLSICSMLTDPNPDDPLVPEIAHVS